MNGTYSYFPGISKSRALLGFGCNMFFESLLLTYVFCLAFILCFPLKYALAISTLHADVLFAHRSFTFSWNSEKLISDFLQTPKLSTVPVNFHYKP